MNNHQVLLIAEAGVNHNGSEELACQLAELALKAGADIVKFQIFKSDQLVSKGASKAAYQTRTTGKQESQLQMLQQLELDYASHRRVADHCKQIGVKYLASAFDLESLTFLASDLDVPFFKIGSGELTNAPFLLAHARYRRKIVLSTGMATLAEVETALGVLAFGFIDSDERPTRDAFRRAYASVEGQNHLKQLVTLLHCTTEYPARIDEINLNAMLTMKQAFQLSTGFSDHSLGHVASTAAVAMGASIIEKHFTLDRDMAGPDHQASMGPDELHEFVASIRAATQCLGSGIKCAGASESMNTDAARKSLVAIADIAAGEVFTTINLGVMRPGAGRSPYEFWEHLGTSSNAAYCEGDLI